MSNFITDQIVNALNQKFGAIGQVSDLSFSRDGISVTKPKGFPGTRPTGK